MGEEARVRPRRHFAIEPNDNHEGEWFAYFTATTTSHEDKSCSGYVKEAEL